MSIIFCIRGGGGVAADIDLCHRVAYPLSSLLWKVNYSEHPPKISKNTAHLTVVVVKTVPT